MRNTTAKLLLACYPVDTRSPALVAVSKLKILTPELTIRGFESLLTLIIKRKWLVQVKVKGESHVQMTQLGIEAISGQFPALIAKKQQEPDDWSLVLFSTPPKGDPSFRYLRRLLLQHGAIRLGRGQYTFSQAIPGDVHSILHRLYASSVYVCRVSEWVSGFISPRILSQKMAADGLTITSGLSNQVDRLLVKYNDKNRLTVNDKKTIAGLYEQLIFILKNSQLGSELNIPQVEPPIFILSKLQGFLML